MTAVARLAHHPGQQLLVGIDQVAEVAQRGEVVLDVFDAGLNPAFLLRIGYRTRADQEAIALGTLGIGTLYLGIVITGFGDGALGVVNIMFPSSLCD
jgi:hypothetical protein